MAEERNNTFNTVLALGYLFFVFTITGFIFILATRLFKNITRLPSVMSCIWVGAAFWWIVFPFTPMAVRNNDAPNIGNELISGGKYDYEITGTVVKFVTPPKADRTAQVYYADKDHRHIKLYLHGAIDGLNNTYQLSIDRNNIVAPTTTDNVELEMDDWARERPRTFIRKYHETHEFWINKWIITTFIMIMAGSYYLMEQCAALFPRQTNVTED